MKRRLFIAVAALSIALLAACGSNEAATDPVDGVSIGNGAHDGGPFLAMAANLTDAVSLTSNIPRDASKEKKRLLKVTSDKKLVAVLEGEHELINYKITPTHIIARVDIKEGNHTCSLIAIPKIPGTSKVLCLNRELSHCSDTGKIRPGYDVRGSEVFFTYQQAQQRQSWSNYCYESSKLGDMGTAVSELRRWDGRSEKVETLFHTEPQPAKGAQLFVTDVFASATNGNLCLEAWDNGLFCRKEGSANWEPVKKFKNSSPSYTPYLRSGNTVLAEWAGESYNEGAALDLATMEREKRSGPLPGRVDFQLDAGGVIGRGGYGANVIVVDKDGNSKEILKLDLDDTIPARLGSYAWYYGKESLRRVNLAEGKLDEKDYFDRTKLLRLASISWALDDLLRVDGTVPAGLMGTSYLTGAGELVQADTQSIQLEHPIDLKW